MKNKFKYGLKQLKPEYFEIQFRRNDLIHVFLFSVIDVKNDKCLYQEKVLIGDNELGGQTNEIGYFFLQNLLDEKLNKWFQEWLNKEYNLN